ncbi:MAG: WD40 repeat domain-containing protein, partial [Cyanobacteria bacterium J06659_2]
TETDTTPAIAQPKSPPSPSPPTSPPLPASPSPITIEVAHEILIRRWSTLRWWLDENRSRLRSQRQIEQAAQQWHTAGQQPEYLLQGVRLEAATELYVNYTDELSQPVQQFIEACIAAQQQDQQRQRRQLRRAQMAIAAISSLAVIALGLGGLAYRQRQQAIANEISALNSLADAQLRSQQPLESLITSIRAGQQLQRLNGFGLSRQTLASGRSHTLATLYQAVTQVSERNRFLGHSQTVNRAVFSPDGSRIASASDDGTVRLWSRTGELLQVLAGSGDRFTDVAFNPEENLLAAANADGSVWLWQLGKETPPTLFNAHSDWIGGLAFSPDGQSLATASRDGTIQLWRVADQQRLQTLSGHQGWVNAVQFSPDGQRLVSGGEDRTLRLWDVNTGQSLQRRSDPGDRVNDLAFSPDGQFLVSASDDQTLGVWSFLDDTFTPLDNGSNRFTSVQVSPDSQLIVAGDANGTVQLWRANSGEPLTQLQGHGATVHSLAFAPTGLVTEDAESIQQVMLLSAGADNTLRLWAAPIAPDR